MNRYILNAGTVIHNGKPIFEIFHNGESVYRIFDGLSRAYPNLVSIFANYPELLPLVAEHSSLANTLSQYPSLASLFVEYPSSLNIILENQSLLPILASHPDLIHSLINTGYEPYMICCNGVFDTGYIPDLLYDTISLDYYGDANTLFAYSQTDGFAFGYREEDINDMRDQFYIACGITEVGYAWLRAYRATANNQNTQTVFQYNSIIGRHSITLNNSDVILDNTQSVKNEINYGNTPTAGHSRNTLRINQFVPRDYRPGASSFRYYGASVSQDSTIKHKYVPISDSAWADIANLSNIQVIPLITTSVLEYRPIFGLSPKQN